MEAENTETQIPIPTSQNSDMGINVGVQRKSFHVRRRRRREPKKNMQVIKEVTLRDNENAQKEEEEEEDMEEMERKIKALQRIVPGGESLEMDKLFDETAGYIMALQCQVKSLRALASFFQRLDKEKTKFGG